MYLIHNNGKQYLSSSLTNLSAYFLYSYTHKLADMFVAGKRKGCEQKHTPQRGFDVKVPSPSTALSYLLFLLYYTPPSMTRPPSPLLTEVGM